MNEPVLTERDGAVMRITLNRPQALNSFNAAMHAHLAAALSIAQTDPHVRVVVLTGAGRGFCAGQDLADLDANAKPDQEIRNVIVERYNPLILQLRNLSKPVIAAVNGVAAGAGANIALACDFVLASKSASFLQAFVHIGLLPDSGGTWFLPRLVGTARAMAMIMLGEKVSAEAAERIGLIYRAVDSDELLSAVASLADRLASLPPQALAAMKQALYQGAPTLEAQLGLEAQMQERLAATQDYAEGVAAFLGKRKPQFSGR
jgi:2-(1,2-epoxy-1,2-dihydrophenyl)acetyl-CoA isomerase